jgi:hypothetical protein
MNKVNDSLIKMVSASTGCIPTIPIELNEEEWVQLFNDSVAHQVHLLVFSEAYKYGKNVNPVIFENWRKSTLFQVLKYNERFAIIGSLLSAFECNNVPILILKGLYFRYLYKEPELRTMGDIDLLTKPHSLNDAINVIQSFGYIQSSKEDPKHLSFIHPQYMPIELHFSLFTESIRKVATDFNNEIWNSTTYYKTDEITFMIPSDSDQLIYCCIHMTNHFGKGGFGLRQLSDFNLLAKKVTETIDWSQLIERANKYGIGKFMEVLLYICHKLFNLNISDAIIDKYSKNEVYINQMIEAILDSGVFGTKNKKTTFDRSLATYMDKHEENIKIFNIKYLFPPRSSLCNTYSYAQKHVILLPIAWIHRLIHNIFRTDLSLSDKIPDSKSVSEYARLFKWLEIKK